MYKLKIKLTASPIMLKTDTVIIIIIQFIAAQNLWMFFMKLCKIKREKLLWCQWYVLCFRKLFSHYNFIMLVDAEIDILINFEL